MRPKSRALRVTFCDAELAHRPAPQEHRQQDTEADALAQSSGDTRAAGAHAEAEDKDGVQQDVEHAAGDKADHGEAGLALVAQDVVHHKAGHHEGRSDEDGPRIGAGVGQDGVGAAQQHHEAGQGGKADPASTMPKTSAVKKLVEANLVAAWVS